MAEAETVTKRIRINGVYLYSFDTQRSLPLSCCDDLDIKTLVNFGELDRKSRNLIRHFPEGTGMVLGTFVGRLDYGHSPNPLNAQFTPRITAVEKVEKVTKEIEKAAWRPPQCKQ